MSATIAIAPACVNVAEIKKAIAAQMEATAARKAHELAEAAKEAAAMEIFEALLGIKSKSELQALTPEQVRAIAQRRIRAGLVQVEGIDADLLLDHVIQKSQSRRNVAWKEEFIAELGATAAAKVTAETAENFSYKFVELPPALPAKKTRRA